MRIGEGFSLGLILVWVGVAMVSDVDNDNPGLNFMVIGGILIASSLLRRMRDEAAGTGILGVILTLVGLNELLESRNVDLPVMAIVVIALGALMIIGSVRPKGAKKWRGG